MPTMPMLLNRTAPASLDGFGSVYLPFFRVSRRLGLRHLVILGLVVFALTLLATLPARAILAASGSGRSVDAVGTIWNGEVAVGDQTAVAWRFAPLRSLMQLGIAADVVVRGGETDMTADAVWRPGAITLQNVSGVAGPGLVNTLMADLPIRCDLSFVVDLDQLVLADRRSGVQGQFRSGAGTCAARNGIDAPPSPLPAMTGRATRTINGSSAWLGPAQSPQGERYAQMTIDRTGKLIATVLPAGSLILPATAGQISIETQL